MMLTASSSAFRLTNETADKRIRLPPRSIPIQIAKEFEVSNSQEFTDEFWNSIRSDMTVMVGTKDVQPKPLTAQFDNDRRAIFFFTAKGTELADSASFPVDATLRYASKGHDLFATVKGTLEVDNDPALIDRL